MTSITSLRCLLNTDKRVYKLCSLDRNFVYGVHWTLNHKKTFKTLF